MENLINQLTSTHDKDAQVNFLQEIGKKLLTEYVIKIGDITIKPLWVEAYYSDTNTGFVDEAVHGNECQKNQYGALYFHHKTDDQRSGVDICLSCGNYYLSYLLKYTLVNGIFKSQAQLSSVIPHELRGNRQERSCKGAKSRRGNGLHETHRHHVQCVQGCRSGYCEGYQPAFCDRFRGEEILAAKNGTIKGIYRRRLFGRPNQHRGAKSSYQP